MVLPQDARDVWVTKQASITCPVCGMTSYHPVDIAEGYCGNCHDFTGVPIQRRESDSDSGDN